MRTSWYLWLGIVCALAVVVYIRSVPGSIPKPLGYLAITAVCFIAYAVLKRTG